MGELLLDWARNILFFMVFLSVISHLLADRSYEKYIRFFASSNIVSLLYNCLTIVFPMLRISNRQNSPLPLYCTEFSIQKISIRIQ